MRFAEPGRASLLFHLSCSRSVGLGSMTACASALSLAAAPRAAATVALTTQTRSSACARRATRELIVKSALLATNPWVRSSIGRASSLRKRQRQRQQPCPHIRLLQHQCHRHRSMGKANEKGCDQLSCTQTCLFIYFFF